MTATPGPRNDPSKALSENPAGFRVWRRLRTKAPVDTDARPAEQIIKGASAESIADFVSMPRSEDLSDGQPSNRGPLLRLVARMFGR